MNGPPAIFTELLRKVVRGWISSLMFSMTGLAGGVLSYLILGGEMGGSGSRVPARMPTLGAKNAPKMGHPDVGQPPRKQMWATRRPDVATRQIVADGGRWGQDGARRGKVRHTSCKLLILGYF
jgi:hypothetical protein